MADVEDPNVRQFVSRFRATVDHYYSEPRGLQAGMRQGPGFAHFAPVEEYRIARFYQNLADAGQASGVLTARPLDSEPEYEVVAIYPKEGTMWHDNPFAIPDVPWVNEVQREAAHLVEEYLRSGEVQAQLMESGFRPGIYEEQGDLLTPPQGLNFKQPEVILGQVPAGTARVIQQSWQSNVGIFDTTLDVTIPTNAGIAGRSGKQ